MVVISEEFEFEIMVLCRHMNAMQRTAAKDTSRLDRSAFTLMSRIDVEGPMSIGQMRDALGLDDSTLNRQTAAMVRRGYVERIPDPDGGTARKFRLTDGGRVALDAERNACSAQLEQIFDDWDDDRLAAVSAAIRSFNDQVEASEGRPWPRPASP